MSNLESVIIGKNENRDNLCDSIPNSRTQKIEGCYY